MNLLTSVLFVALLLTVARWGRHREPSWVSRDGRRFIARARLIDDRGARPGRWMHVRGGIGRDAVVIQPGFTGSRAVAGIYTRVERLVDDHHGAVLYAARGEKSVVLRVRSSEQLVSALDAIAAQSS